MLCARPGEPASHQLPVNEKWVFSSLACLRLSVERDPAARPGLVAPARRPGTRSPPSAPARERTGKGAFVNDPALAGVLIRQRCASEGVWQDEPHVQTATSSSGRAGRPPETLCMPRVPHVEAPLCDGSH